MNVKKLDFCVLSAGTGCLTALAVSKNPLLSNEAWLNMANVSAALIIVYDSLSY